MNKHNNFKNAFYYWIPVLLWAGLIFYLSGIDAGAGLTLWTLPVLLLGGFFSCAAGTGIKGFFSILGSAVKSNYGQKTKSAVLRSMGRIFIDAGAAGTFIALMGMLSVLADKNVILGHMAIAALSVTQGLILWAGFFGPLASRTDG